MKTGREKRGFFGQQKENNPDYIFSDERQAIMNTFYFEDKPTPKQLKKINQSLKDHPLHLNRAYKAHVKQEEAIDLREELSAFIKVKADNLSDNELVAQGLAQFYKNKAKNIQDPKLIWVKLALQNAIDEVLEKEARKGVNIMKK